MSVAVVGVLGAVGVIGVVASEVGKDKADNAAGPVSAPSGLRGTDDLAIPVGAPDAPSTLTVWEDFRCPACAQFENAFRDTIHDLERAGQLKVEYHLATIIDGNMGGSGSLHAANAAACAQDAYSSPRTTTCCISISRRRRTTPSRRTAICWIWRARSRG